MDPAVAYGATILAVIATASYLGYLQLGDGDILTVSNDGNVTRTLPMDKRLIANETTSLCLKDAQRDFRVAFQAISGSPPALILMSTDGYADSFEDEKPFLKVGADILEMLRKEGIEYVNDNMENWLTEASQQGSGDDITLGIICRRDVISKLPEQIKDNNNSKESQESRDSELQNAIQVN